MPKFKFIHIKKHTPGSMMTFKTELMKLDIYNNLNKDDFADPNENYNLPEEMITDSSNVPSALNSLERPATDWARITKSSEYIRWLIMIFSKQHPTRQAFRATLRSSTNILNK